ncbi:MAG: hypothetical protein ABGZ23_07670 [Fuerstiella sp.]|nr:hypothetical protein [Fuerstiella sp.]
MCCAIDNRGQPDPGAIDAMGLVSVYFHKLNLCATALTLVACFGPTQKADAAPRLEDLARKVGVRILADATSAKDVLESTKKWIPNEKMSSNAQARAAYILDNMSQYRRMPSLQYPINPNIYQYLINHPDIAISTWRVMGISTLQMWQTDDFGYEAKATDGSTGTADILWRDGNQCLFIVEGRYQSPLLPGSIEASALVWLQYRFVRAKDGSLMVNQQIETFLHFPSSAIEAIAKLTSRLTNSILDRNVFEVSLYARMMTKAAEKEPEWIEQLAQRMDGVPPRRRMELALVAHNKNPTTAVMHPVSNSREPSVPELPASGEFHVFEMSLQQVITHVPLVPPAERREFPSGQQIGSDHRNTARPYQFITPNGGKTIAEQQAHTRLAVQYGSRHSGSNINGAPNSRNSASPNDPDDGSRETNVAAPVTPTRAVATQSTPIRTTTTLLRSESTPAKPAVEFPSHAVEDSQTLKPQPRMSSPEAAVLTDAATPTGTPPPANAGESSDEGVPPPPADD